MNQNRFPHGLASQLIIAILGWALLCGFAAAQTEAEPAESPRWAIALHGGAGAWSRDMASKERESLEQSLRRALESGQSILVAEGSALDAVETVIAMLEDDPQFNAGRGAVFTQVGAHELDASIMDGAKLRTGAVAGVTTVKNPIRAARLVMERSPHVLLAGAGADAFAAANGCERVAQDYFYTEQQFHELQDVRAKAGLKPLEHPAYDMPSAPAAVRGQEHGGAGETVGCVALDVHGNLAAGTSTGGLTGKLPGRIGDAPLCGAGTYADNATCAVSCTGKGEEYIRHAIASRVALLVAERKLSVDESVQHCLKEILQPGDGGIIAVDRQGRISLRATTEAMPRGAADSTGRFETAIWFDP